jgi:nitrate/TMAO reductase-like tetraheme cytochrome c subunit
MAKSAGVLLAILAVVAGLVVLVGGVAGTAYTSSSTFCTSCHEMSTRYVSWTRSTHNQVECMDCHSGVGIGGYINAKIGGARQAFQHYFGEIGDIHAVVEDPVCMKCHFFSKTPGFVYDQVFHDNPLYVPDELHRVHFNDKESTCSNCHAGLVHGSLEGGIPIQKETCVECHRSKKVLVEIVHDGENWKFPNWINK